MNCIKMKEKKKKNKYLSDFDFSLTYTYNCIDHRVYHFYYFSKQMHLLYGNSSVFFFKANQFMYFLR